MEIHELNTFSGTPGSGDFFATDNGEDTSKISAEALFAPLNERIDNIIAGPAPSAEEIVDARLGADGVTYPSLGAAIRDQVSDLKSALIVNEINSNFVTEDSILDFAELKDGISIRHYQPLALGFGWLKADGTASPDTSTLAYDSNYLKVSEGDVVTSLGARDAIRFLTAYDSQHNVISSAGSDSIIYKYTVPAGVSYIRATLYTDDANDYNSMPQLKIISAQGFYAIKEIENVTQLKEASFDVVKEITAGGFGWINSSGEYHADSDEVLAYSEFIRVNAGDVIKSNNPTRTNLRFVCAYDYKQTVIQSAGTDNIVSSYTVPADVRYVRVTVWLNTAHDLASMPSITIHRSGNYILPIIDPTLTSDVYPAPARVIGQFVSDYGKEKSITKRGNLQSGSKWEFEENHISTEKVLSFSGTIGTFSAIQMGHGYSDSEGNYIKIDASNVYEYGGGSLLNTFPHGLSIENNIQVKIEVKAENAYNAYLTLASSGMTFTQIMPSWYGDSGKLFVESIDSSLTDCSFGWTCRNYNKPVYIFGDSYLGFATPNRWAYYLIRDGYNQLLDGFGGRNSAWALKSLKNALIHSTPKYILWCMGMNDADNGAINASWLSCVEELLAICESSGITPILATIPNVTRSDRDNTYKNYWVRNSGYRYVDFASAVGANAVHSSWYSGMLSSDGLHPNTKGAVALYYQVLADFPEITITEK